MKIRSRIISFKNLTLRRPIFSSGFMDAACPSSLSSGFHAPIRRRIDESMVRLSNLLPARGAAHLIEDLIKRASRMNYYTYVIQRGGEDRRE